MDEVAIFAGIGAVITAAAGLALVIREFRDREHRAARTEIDELTADLYRLDQAYIAQRRYNFELRQELADLGGEAMAEPSPAYHPHIKEVGR